MASLEKSKWQYLALGGACAAAVVTVAYMRQSAAAQKPEKKAKPTRTAELPPPSRPAPALNGAPATKLSKPAPAATAPGKPRRGPALKGGEARDIGFDELEAWASALRKKDTEHLPSLLLSTEKIIEKDPRHQALPKCLKALVYLVGGNQEVDRVSAIAVEAGAYHPEEALEVLNALFKDRRQRGGFQADKTVVDFAISILKKALKDEVPRAVYQRACRLFDWLALDEENRAYISEKDGTEALLSVLEKFHDDPGVLLEGCAFLQNVPGHPKLDSGRVAAVCTKCLETFPENGELAWRAMAALHGTAIVATKYKLNVAKLACASVTKHPKFDTVMEWAAKLLYKYSKPDDAGQVVRDWLKAPEQKAWVKAFKEAPHGMRKANREAEQWVKELCRLVGA